MDLRDGSEAIIKRIKGNDTCNNMVANILTTPPSIDPRGRWDQNKKKTFSEQSHAAYQKVNYECSICKQINCHCAHHQTLRWSQRAKHFFEIRHVTGVEHRETFKHLFSPYSLTRPWDKHFTDSSHVAYHIRRNGVKSTTQVLILS